MNLSKAGIAIRIISILFAVLLIKPVKSQSMNDPSPTLADTTQTMNLDEFYKIILTFHPVVRQAGLLTEVAQQEIRLARGSFDPKLAAAIDHKEFEDKTYYSKLDAYLSFPTWFPVNPRVGYQQNTGELLNAEDAIPGGKQLYAGISVPLGRGLITDERRAAVKQAELFTTIATADQIKIINKILLDAAKEYWHWFFAYNQLMLLDRSVALADDIFKRVKLNAAQGEASLLDTIQAKITLQSRQVDRQEAILALQNSIISVSNYLWDAQGEPLQFNNLVAPMMATQDPIWVRGELLEDLLNRARENHPDLVRLNVNLDQLEVEKSLAKEFMKPQMDFQYSALSQPTAVHQIDFFNDYKLGVDFSFPVFLRKERSKLALTKLKIEGTKLKRSQSEREILNEINTTFNELRNTIVILKQQEEVVALYNMLLKAEILNLENGESDLFKINIQQEKLIQSQSKLLKLKAEQQKQKAFLYWAAGVKNLDFQ